MAESERAVSDIEVHGQARAQVGGRMERSPYFWALPPFLRVLLITDGTVTRSLEAYFSDPIEVLVLSHAESASRSYHAAIEVVPGDPVLTRRVILRGKRTGMLYAYAESIIVTARLPDNMQQRLIQERIGIGEMLCDSQLETYREILAIRGEKAGPWAHELSIDDTASVVVRNYAIHFGARASIEIEEVFPESPFRR